MSRCPYGPIFPNRQDSTFTFRPCDPETPEAEGSRRATRHNYPQRQRPSEQGTPDQNRPREPLDPVRTRRRAPVHPRSPKRRGAGLTQPTFQQFQRPLPGLSSHDRLLLFHALPESVQQSMWDRLAIQVEDRRYADGDGPFIDRRPKPKRRPIRTASNLPSDSWLRGTEALASIPAETYLTVLAPESEPTRGKCRCPLPDHEDHHPSATYKDTVWYCHVCGIGGTCFTIAAAKTGLNTRGRDFIELRKWIARQMLGAA